MSFINLFLAAVLVFAVHHAQAQNWGSGVRSMPPIEEDDAPKPGIEYFPKSQYLPNTGQNPERGAKISYADAINCAGLIEVINLARMNNPGDETLADVGASSTSSRHRAWDAMIATSPQLKSLPFQEAERTRAALLNKHIDKTIYPYFDDLPRLVRDYRRCQALRLIGPG